jgi:hypothetical protein
VAVFNCANASNPRIINEIQCRYVVDRPILVDTILYAVLQGGVEVFNVANPARVSRIRYLPISAVDMCIRDSLAYTIDADSFKVYRVLSPDSFARLGAVADSGYYIFADDGFAYLCDRWGIYIIDATNPASPRRATTLTGAQGGAAWVEDGYCYYTTTNPGSSFVVANVTDPYHPTEVGRRDGLASYELYKLDGYVYMPNFAILEVFNPSQPGLVSTLTHEGFGTGVWTRSPFSHSFVAAGSEGMGVIDIRDPVNPALDTLLSGTGESYDASVSGGFAYVANDYCGMKVIDLGTITNPREVGAYDSVGQTPKASAVAARDSFAYLLTQIWLPSGFRTLDVSDPANPTLAGVCRSGWGRAVVVRDSLAYVAVDYRLEIFSIANPRVPRLVGSLGFTEGPVSLCLKDSIAYLTCGYSGLKLVNIRDPARPVVIGACGGTMNATGVAVQDTVAYVASFQHGLQTVSVADPRNPCLIATLPIPGEYSYDVAVSGNRAYVGAFELHLIDVGDPARPVQVGFYKTPYRVRRVQYREPYLYTACFGAGVCILQDLQSGIADVPRAADARHWSLSCWPNPASTVTHVTATTNYPEATRFSVLDVTGRAVDHGELRLVGNGQIAADLDLSGYSRGTYFVKTQLAGSARYVRLIKL